MTATRQDAWSEDDDLLLAEVVLRHIREGSTQLNAFEEVGYRLNRTSAACGFRWNSLVRKKYESAIQIAKAQRKQRKAKGNMRFQPEFGRISDKSSLDLGHNQVSEYTSSTDSKSIISQAEQAINLQDSELGFDQVIRFLKQQKDNFKRVKQLERQLREKEEEISRISEDNRKMKKELGSVQTDYQTINEDYKALIQIMDRARKLAFLAEEQSEEKVSFKMDRNGNLERLER